MEGFQPTPMRVQINQQEEEARRSLQQSSNRPLSTDFSLTWEEEMRIINRVEPSLIFISQRIHPLSKNGITLTLNSMIQVQEAHCWREGECSNYCLPSTGRDLHEHAVEDREQRPLRLCFAGCLLAILWFQANLVLSESILLKLLVELWAWIREFWQDLLC